MSYLRKKLQAIMACADFKGYLREVMGYPLTLTDCMGSDLVSLSVTGNAVQDGTPSPDAPVEVQGVGEKTGNLLDAEGIVDTTEDYDMEIVEYSGRQCLTWLDNANTAKHRCMEGQFKENTQYTFAFTGYAEKGMTISIIYTDGTTSSLSVPGGGWNATYKQTLARKTVSYWKGSHNYGQRVYLDLASSQILEGNYTADTLPTYEPYGYKVPVKVGGINLFNLIGRTEVQLNGMPNAAKEIPDNSTLLNVSSNGFNAPGSLTSYSVDDNCVTIVPSNNAGYGLGFSFSVAEGDTYTMSYSADALAEVYASFYDAEGIYLSRSASKQITVPPNAVMMVITTSKKYETHSDNIGIPISVTNLMLVKGTYTADTMPPFEVYHEPQTVNVYADKPLYAVGDVGDTITLDFDAKTAVRTDRIKITELKSTDAWNDTWFPSIVKSLSSANYASAAGNIMSNYFSINADTTDPAAAITSTAGTAIGIQRANLIDGVTDLDTFKIWLSDKSVYAYYQLATPTTTDISALQDWDAFPPTWRGTVVISAGTTIQPSSMAAQYYATQKED